jgi:adenylate kinase family enzyme
MRRVWVTGASGSGKTTLAAALAERLGVPHVELDALHHGPDWAEPDPDEFRASVATEIARDGWVIDGSYRSKLGDLVPRSADTIVWLDLPLPVVLGRLAARSAVRLARRTELWSGNRESVRGVFWGRESLVWWAAARHRGYRRELPELFARPEYHDTTIVRLRSPSQVSAWLAAV